MRRTGDDPFVDDREYPTVEMKVNDLKCTLNMPRALESRNDGSGKEIAQGLPEYNPRPIFVVDEFPASPTSWMRGSATEGSFFVPVLPGHGLWLDLNANQYHTHHVAALVSIQGVNAITGQPTEDFALEQYRNNCPVHNKPFGHDRHCEQCGYMWDDQNYLATTGTPFPLFWLDGFRAKDGVVRQFYFTEETMRGVAAQILGDRRVFAIGIAFYLSKEEKPAPEPSRYHHFGSPGGDSFGLSFGGSKSIGSPGGDSFGVLRSCSLSEPVEESQIEIAAGARIDQRIYEDPNPLDFWQPKPVATMYLNYCDVETALKIIAAGRRDMTGKGEGFMEKLAVGK